MCFPSWLDWIGFFPQIFPANHPLLYPLKVVFLGQVKSPNFFQISLSQADKGFPAFSYTEFLAATFDRSRHSTEAVPWPWATQRALAHRAESNKKRWLFHEEKWMKNRTLYRMLKIYYMVERCWRIWQSAFIWQLECAFTKEIRER